MKLTMKLIDPCIRCMAVPTERAMISNYCKDCMSGHIYQAQRDLLRKVVDDLREMASRISTNIDAKATRGNNLVYGLLHDIADAYEKELNDK